MIQVQCDEIWGFVGKKRNSRHGGEANFAHIGDAWTWVAIERNTKIVLAFELGKRTISSAMRFMEKVSVATSADQRFQLTSDGLQAYNYAVGMKLDGRVDYAQLIKIYTRETPEAQRRYSPAKLAEAIPTPVYGDPDGSRICTSHVERQNLTMRMCIRRLTRLTNGFSKKWKTCALRLRSTSPITIFAGYMERSSGRPRWRLELRIKFGGSPNFWHKSRAA